MKPHYKTKTAKNEKPTLSQAIIKAGKKHGD
jgi:hypothetical protein